MPLTLTTGPVAQVVKHETTLRHREVEAMMLPALQAIGSPHAYAGLLKMFYGFYFPLEQRIRCLLLPHDLPDLDRRRIVSLLQNDLATLGCKGAVPLCEALPQINNPAEAFGAMYVLEGSTLGGRIISKMLSKNEAVPAPALRFFNGYGEQTGLMWTAFVEALNRQADTASVVQSANETFVCLKKWMQEVLTHEAAN